MRIQIGSQDRRLGATSSVARSKASASHSARASRVEAGHSPREETVLGTRNGMAYLLHLAGYMWC